MSRKISFLQAYLSAAQGWEHRHPVTVMENKIFSFMMIIDHDNQRQGRVNRQNIPELADRQTLGSFQPGNLFAVTGEFGIVATQPGKESNIKFQHYTLSMTEGRG